MTTTETPQNRHRSNSLNPTPREALLEEGYKVPSIDSLNDGSEKFKAEGVALSNNSNLPNISGSGNVSSRWRLRVGTFIVLLTFLVLRFYNFRSYTSSYRVKPLGRLPTLRSPLFSSPKFNGVSPKNVSTTE